MGGSWPRPRRLKNSWEYLYGGGERGAGGVCRGKSYQENHGGAASPLRALRLREFYSRAAVILCEVVALRVKYERLLASDKG